MSETQTMFQILQRWTRAVKFECELPAEVVNEQYGLRIGFAVKAAIKANAVLRDADLRDAVLRGADLEPIRADLIRVLTDARAEAPAFLAALLAGRVDGCVYRGDCACLVGTIANARGVDVATLPQNPDSLIEKFVLGISRGDTPATNPVARLVAEWTETFIAKNAP